MVYPKCEVCGLNESQSLSAFGTRDKLAGNKFKVEWKLACFCTALTEDYHITFDAFTDDDTWLDHMRDKLWFDEAEFLACVKRAGLEAR